MWSLCTSPFHCYLFFKERGRLGLGGWGVGEDLGGVGGKGKDNSNEKITKAVTDKGADLREFGTWMTSWLWVRSPESCLIPPAWVASEGTWPRTALGCQHKRIRLPLQRESFLPNLHPSSWGLTYAAPCRAFLICSSASKPWQDGHFHWGKLSGKQLGNTKAELLK